MVVIVLGANGQLGQAIKKVVSDSGVRFYFFTSSQVDITDQKALETAFNETKPDFCINAAAYTAVDKAEIEQEKADLINRIGVKNIVQACLNHQTILVHISTDFVFDGEKHTPYLETDPTHPQGVYGATKLAGELEISTAMKQYFIIRTSWLYSEFGANFKKTMLRLAKEKDALSVVNDQVGSPTHAIDLAEMILKILLSKSKNYGIYHFSNEGSASWYDFAKKIFELNSIAIDLRAISTLEFPTLAKRPKFSVLDTSKIKKEFKTTIHSWEKALKIN